MSVINQVANFLSTTHRALNFTFKANSLDSDVFKVIDFNVEEGLSHPFIIKLSLASSNNRLSEADVVDQNGLLSIYRNNQLERYFHGVVFAFTKGNTGRHHTFYEITMVPEFSRLSLRTNARIFQNKTVMEITEELLGEMGITNYGLSIRHTHEPREFCVQYSESDLAFIERILSEEGIFFYFEHNKDKHTIIFADDNSVVDELPFPCLYNNSEGGMAESSCIRSLTHRAKVAPSDAALKDYSFKHPSFSFLNTASGNDMDYQKQNYEHYMYPGRFKDDAVGKSFSKTRIDYLRRDAKTISAQGDIAQIISGYLLKIMDHPSITADKRWLVTHVRHEGTQPQSLDNEGGVGATTYHNVFYALPYEQQWKPEPETKPRIYGSHIAKVVGPSGEEIYTDEFGRVKVQFPWDRYGGSDEKSSCWIRVAQNWAGASWGHIAIPRIDQEVIISFLEGDPDQPIITGRTYDAIHPTPYKLPGLKIHSTIKSKEHHGSGYNELLLDDTTGEIKTKLHSTHEATQLTMGYLTHPRSSDGGGEARGDGFELRTDSWGSIRAGKGLYISSDKREKATGDQLDIQEAINQLESALHIAKELANAANVAKTGLMDIADQSDQLSGVFKELKSAGILINAPEGVAITSPRSVQLASSKNLTMSTMESTDISAYQDFRLVAKEKVSLLAVKDELKIVANQGPLKIEAQDNELNLAADQKLQISSSNDQVIIAGKKEIVLTSGGAYIKIKDGEVEIGAPKPLRIRTSGFNVEGSNSINYDYLSFAQYDPKINDEMFIVKDPNGDPIADFEYKIVRDDGEEFFGITNQRGETSRVSTGAEALGLKLYEYVKKEENKS